MVHPPLQELRALTCVYVSTDRAHPNFVQRSGKCKERRVPVDKPGNDKAIVYERSMNARKWLAVRNQ